MEAAPLRGAKRSLSPPGGGHPSDGAEKLLPQKKFYRARAHSNPLSDAQFSVPISPSEFDWSSYFPAFFPQAGSGTPAGSKGPDSSSAAQEAGGPEPPRQQDGATTSGGGGGGAPAAVPPLVRFADVGCGFGGLMVTLSPMFPDTLMVGMELRDKVSEYVRERVEALRAQHPGKYGNIAVVRTNAMKYLPNYFLKGQLTKMFFLFPDPHFKEKNHRRRIITYALLAEYAYVMSVGGVLYTVTDVEELYLWMDRHLASHPLFAKLSEEEARADPIAPLLVSSSEEGLKVERNGGKTYQALYRRIGSSPCC